MKQVAAENENCNPYIMLVDEDEAYLVVLNWTMSVLRIMYYYNNMSCTLSFYPLNFVPCKCTKKIFYYGVEPKSDTPMICMLVLRHTL